MKPQEHESLLEQDDPHAVDVPPEVLPRRRWPVFLGLAVVTLAVAGSAQRPHRVKTEVAAADGASDFATDGAAAAAARTLHFSLRSVDYPKKAAGAGYKHLTVGKVAEPHRATVLAVVQRDAATGAALTLTDPASENDGHGDAAWATCSWAAAFVRGGGVYDELPANAHQPAAAWTAAGALSELQGDATLSFPAPGTYRVTAQCGGATAAASVSVSEDVTVAYVRRELRQLTKKDRDAYLDTFLTLHRTSTAAGQAKYGKHYKSLADLSLMHLNAAADRREDHVHDGMGFLTQHVAMTMEFELALQSVQPHLAVPYWDFTVDWAYVADHSDADAGRALDTSLIFTQGALFKGNFFGTTDDAAHTVVGGRMGHLAVPQDFSAATHSPYGFLRAPWNINPSKYVTRYHSFCGAKGEGTGLDWPSCATHFRLSHSSAYASWTAYVWDLSYAPHGPVHAWVGGVGGQCDSFTEVDTWAHLQHTPLKQSVANALKANSFNLLKFAWRELALEMPTSCSSDTPVSECMWTCHEGADAVMDTLLSSAYLSEFPKEVWDDDLTAIVKKVFCDTPFWPGEHLDAGSPVEASFWPVHPGLDRLTQYKALVQPFEDKAWPATDSAHSDVCSNAHAVPGHPVGNCLGHHAADVTYWASVVQTTSGNGDGAYTKQYLTNAEVLAATTPDTYGAPYIYEHFEWTHCEAHGVSFKAVA